VRLKLQVLGAGYSGGGGIHAVLSLFRARQGGVRLCCYFPSSSAEMQLLLAKQKISELDLPAVPHSDAPELWVEWGKELFERTLLRGEAGDGELVIGPPIKGANGLPPGFSMTGRGSGAVGGGFGGKTHGALALLDSKLQRGERALPTGVTLATRKLGLDAEASRFHVGMWFRM